MEKRRGVLFVISGPSGVGKDTLVNEYLKDNNAHLSVSATTRKPRIGEVDGKDYYFLTEEEFKKRVKEEDFLEYAIYNDCYYGTPKSKIEEYLNNGIDVILIIEVQGALLVKDKLPNSVLIFIMPPSLEVLKERISKRGLDSEEMIENRLKIAVDEIQASKKYDYVLVNNEINNAKEKLKLIINAAKEKNNEK